MSLPSDDYHPIGFNEDRIELERTLGLIQEVAAVFPRFSVEDSWPYELKHNDSVRKMSGYSQSTNAMILFGLAAIAGQVAAGSPLLASIRPDLGVKFNDGEKAILKKSAERLATECAEIIETYDGQVSFSGSFGFDDPFTLTWVREIDRSAAFGWANDKVSGALKERAKTRAREVLESLGASTGVAPSLLKWEPDKPSAKGPNGNKKIRKGNQAIDHALPVLRWIRLALSVHGNALDAAVRGTAFRYMQSRVHEQLSESEIAGFQFDASELVFALEGQLALNPNSVSQPLLERIRDVIGRSQKTNPYWRAVKPFVATPQGQILLPLSVETANSLLRCCALLEEGGNEKAWFSVNLGLFKRYAEWLRSRLKRGFARLNEQNAEFVGWHSEHVHLHDGIHLWETSQVLLFLAQYAPMLDRHIGRASLRAVNLSAKEPGKIGSRKPVPPSVYWTKHRKIGEPMAGLKPASKYRVYDHVGEHFILPRCAASNSGKEIEYSMLLYGPPGTGKSGFAEEISKALNWPLITVTPSDFIRGGESQVEAQAKTLFEVLGAQSDAVVLFDEIDRMILDRDSKSYAGQSDLFQFMTPGMLTKLKDLREGKRIVFVVATNYAERIDPAAKRRGRIDFQALLPPPDSAARVEILRGLGVETAEPELADLLNLTRLMTYGELKQVVSAARALSGGLSAASLKRAAGREPAAISLGAYVGRIKGGDDSGGFPKKPLDEFFVLLYLLLEGPKATDDGVRRAVEGRLQEARRWMNEVWSDPGVGGAGQPCDREGRLRSWLLTHVHDEQIVEEIAAWYCA